MPPALPGTWPALRQKCDNGSLSSTAKASFNIIDGELNIFLPSCFDEPFFDVVFDNRGLQEEDGPKNEEENAI